MESLGLFSSGCRQWYGVRTTRQQQTVHEKLGGKYFFFLETREKIYRKK
jgi:hypothetical protein